MASEETDNKPRKRLTLADPLVIEASPQEGAVEDLLAPSEVSPENLSYEETEEAKRKRAQQEALDPRLTQSTTPEPAEALGRMAEFAAGATIKPALRAVGGAIGVAEGAQSIFDHFLLSFGTSKEAKKILKALDNPDLTPPQRQARLDQLEELENLYYDQSDFGKVVRDVDKELDDRFEKDSNFQNAISDLRDVTTAFPTLAATVIEAAFGADPDMMRQLGFMMSGGGVASTIATLNPNKLGRNFQARPASVILGLHPVGKIVSRSPKAMQLLRGKFGKQADRFLEGIDKFDNVVRSGMQKLADVEVGRLASVGPGRRTGLGIVNDQVVQVGKAAKKKTDQGRVIDLLPGQRYMTAGDIAQKFVDGAKAGFMAGVPVEAGLVYAAARIIYPNKPYTRKLTRQVAQLLRHTSAQAGGNAELAVRGLMMASAEQKNRMRSIADRIGKAFEEEDALAARYTGAERAPLATGKRQDIEYDFSGGELRLSRVQADDAIAKLEAQLKKLEAEPSDVKPGSRKYTNNQIRKLRGEIQALRKAVDADNKNIYPSERLSSALGQFDQLMSEMGISPDVSKMLQYRLANAADRNSILLQNGDIAKLVIENIRKKYGDKIRDFEDFGTRQEQRGVVMDRIAERIGDIAESPTMGTKQVSAKFRIGDDLYIDLDSEVRSVFESLPRKKQQEVLGQVASNSALRYSQLPVEAAKSAALKAEATKLGIGSALKGVPLSSVQPETYALALARMLAGKDVTRGGVSLPQAIPRSAMGEDGVALAAALRNINSRTRDKILNDVLGSSTPRERANFQRVLDEVAEEVREYIPEKKTDFTDKLRATIIDNPDAPADLVRLAKQLDKNKGDYLLSPGLQGTINWLAATHSTPGVWRNLLQYFKGNVTFRNITPHLNNAAGVAGRIMLGYAEDPATFAKRMLTDSSTYLNHKAGKLGDYRKNTRVGSDEYYTNRSAAIVDESGIANTDFVAGELLRSTRDGVVPSGRAPGKIRRFLRSLAETKPSMFVRKLDDLASKAYAQEDNMPKLHIGMNRSREVLRDLADLEPGQQITLKTSPVSTRTMFKDRQGRLIDGTPDNPGRRLTNKDVDKIVASNVRQHVRGYIVAYDERSGLNRLIVNNAVLAPFAPFFTFWDKAGGMAGRKGFIEHLLFPDDGVVSTSPKIAARQIRDAAALAGRRAVLVNSFLTMASRERDMLAEALAFDSAVPSNVIFEMLSDGDSIQYRDLASMSVFGPGEVKYRALAYTIGKMMEAFGVDKNPKLTNKQKQFFDKLKSGDVAHLTTIGGIFGLDRGPVLSLFEVVLNDGNSAIGAPKSLGNELMKRVAPFAMPAPLFNAINEVVSSISPELEAYTGRQISIDDPELNETRRNFILRRFLLQGGRKIRFDEGTRSVYDRRVKQVRRNQSILTRHLKKTRSILEGQIINLENEIEQERKNQSVGSEMVIDTDDIQFGEKLKQLSTVLEERKAALEKTDRNLEDAENAIDDLVEAEEDRLYEAFEFAKKVDTMRNRLKRSAPKPFLQRRLRQTRDMIRERRGAQ